MPNTYYGVNVDAAITYGEWNSSNYGIVVGAAPSYDKPRRKIQRFDVPGRNGAVLYQQDAWEDTTRSYKIWIDEAVEESGGGFSGTLTDRIYAAVEKLYATKGYTYLTDTFEPDIKRLAYYSGGNDVSNELMAYGESTLTFTCRPERFYKDYLTTHSFSVGTMTNPTQYTAKPLIHIKGSGTVTLTMGGNTISIDLSNHTDIMLDCETMDAYWGTTNLNSIVSGDFPVLKPGSNSVSKTGSTSKLEIAERYFTL